jgi:hypothetical protein
MMVIDIEKKFVRGPVEPDAVIDESVIVSASRPRIRDLISLEDPQVQPNRMILWAIGSHHESFAVSPVGFAQRPQGVYEINLDCPFAKSRLNPSIRLSVHE